MRKVALVFVLAVLAPSLVLAWLAIRSLHDQQFLLERQQSLIDQHVTDSFAQAISDYLTQQQREFSAQVERMAAAGNIQTVAARFDDQLCQRWPLAEVGFCVTAAGKILSPLPNARPAAQLFRLDNSSFLGNREPVEVYLAANNAGGGANGFIGVGSGNSKRTLSKIAEQPAVSTLFVSTQLDLASANLAEIPGNGESSRDGTNSQKQSFPPGDIAGDLNTYAYGGNAGGDSLSNPSRGTANQLSYLSASSRAMPAGQAAQPQRQEPKVEGFFAPHNSAAASQTFASNKAIGEGFPEDRISSDMTVSIVPASPANAAIGRDDVPPGGSISLGDNLGAKDSPAQPQSQNSLKYKAAAAQSRNVSPQSQAYQIVEKSKADNAEEPESNLSKVIPAEAEFRQLIGNQADGMLARFLQNKLKLMCWHRLGAQPDLIFGAQLNLERVVDGLRQLAQTDRSWGDEICLAVLDENARPVVLSREKFLANWKHPFVATEVGESLPHWEVAAYLVNPALLTQAAHTAKLTLGLLIAVLVIAIGIGSLLIVRALEAELKLARKKTDFVSNVSHELKTPLTSIRMFSELLAEGRVTDPVKQHSYLQIITAEAGRLTRLINNVLDFSRMERGEKKYSFQACDLTNLVRTAAETFRPHLETSGFQFTCELPAGEIPVRGDPDALSQVMVNLLSNAEKYSNGGKEISLQLIQRQSPLAHAEIKVLDRGPGVPRGSEEKIFEKFYRAHDSLSSGVQGSGLGLTIARQIARAHGGEVVYELREGGGSCFVLRLPVSSAAGL